MRHERQSLLIDADDTLWETNLNFERTLAAFHHLLAPLGYTEEHVRRQVDQAERRNIQRRGYGAGNFLLTLEEVYLQLAGPRAQPPHLEEIRRFSRWLLDAPPRLFDGVGDTLGYLAPRHRLFLFTKGNPTEQGRKVAASGLERFFEAWEVVPEKTEAAYRDLVERHRLPFSDAWMVGNSPRFDINPALAAGLNAVFIPAQHSWEYENEEIRRGPEARLPARSAGGPDGPALGGRLLVLKSFRELRQHF